MIRIFCFTFNPFSENTYLLADETGEAVIIDPGMSNSGEEKELADTIAREKLRPVKLLNTHCHIDHILGNAYCAGRYALELHMHSLDQPTLDRGEQSAMLFGVNYTPYTGKKKYIEEGDIISFGNSTIRIVFVPGHAPGHVAFISDEQKFVIGGDVLFRGSVGRVDLPGCVPEDLVQSIRTKMYKLPEDYVVYPGHGPETTIGEEKQNNPFVRETTQQLIP